MRGNPKLLEKGKTSAEMVLRFLYSHTYSTKDVLQALTGMSDNGIWRLLKKLVAEELLICEAYPTAYHGKITIYGISLKGVHVITPLHETPNDAKRFEPSRFRVANFQHQLDIQRLALWAKQKGYALLSTKDFYREVATQGDKRADAVLIIDNQRIAIEIERTPKTRLRYSEILINYFRELKKGTFNKVWYLMPDEKLCSSIERVIKSIKAVNMKGELTTRSVSLTPEHWAYFEFRVHPFYSASLQKGDQLSFLNY